MVYKLQIVVLLLLLFIIIAIIITMAQTLSFRSQRNLSFCGFLCMKTPSSSPVSTERISMALWPQPITWPVPMYATHTQQAHTTSFITVAIINTKVVYRAPATAPDPGGSCTRSRGIVHRQPAINNKMAPKTDP